MDILEAAKEWSVFPEDLLGPEDDTPPRYANMVTWIIRRREWRNAQAAHQNLHSKPRTKPRGR